MTDFLLKLLISQRACARHGRRLFVVQCLEIYSDGLDEWNVDYFGFILLIQTLIAIHYGQEVNVAA